METNQWTLTKILNRAIIQNKEKYYTFNKMPCINSKPDLQAGNENLQEYTAELQLHYSFCNPKKIIEILEKQASSKESFDWIYQKEYKGIFVIDEINKKTIKQIDDNIFFAEINLNLVEVPVNSEYQEQNEETLNLDKYEQYGENSNKLQEFKEKLKTSIKNNIESALSGDILISENLSDASKEIFENVRIETLNDISKGNYQSIYNNISTAITNINNGNYNISDIGNLKSALEKIPNLVLDKAVRS